MKLCYLAHSRVPTNRAHGYQIMAMCESFGLQTETQLLLPNRKPIITEDPFTYYHIEKKFSITKLWSLDLYETALPRKLVYWIDALTFAFSVAWYAQNKIEKQEDVIFSRDVVSAFILSLRNYNVIFEVHDLPGSPLFKILFKKVRGVVVTNSLKKEIIMKKWGVAENKILIAHHGVKTGEFLPESKKSEIRAKLGISQEKKIAVYTGHLYESKGAPTLVEAAQFIDEKTMIYIVGGTDNDQKKIQSLIEKVGVTNKVVLTGNIPHPQIPEYLCAADIAVIPSSGKFLHGAVESSPLKLFEYMAAGKPIIASRLPAIEEAADGAPINYVTSDNPQELAQKINEIIPTSVEYKNLVSWEQRAQKILTFARDLCRPSSK